MHLILTEKCAEMGSLSFCKNKKMSLKYSPPFRWIFQNNIITIYKHENSEGEMGQQITLETEFPIKSINMT